MGLLQRYAKGSENVYNYVVEKNGRAYGALTEVARIVGMHYYALLWPFWP